MFVNLQLYLCNRLENAVRTIYSRTVIPTPYGYRPNYQRLVNGIENIKRHLAVTSRELSNFKARDPRKVGEYITRIGSIIKEVKNNITNEIRSIEKAIKDIKKELGI